MSSHVDITGLSKAAVLAALYNRSKAQGMGWMHFDPTPMTETEATQLLTDTTNDMGYPKRAGYFDYLKGRVMKVDLSGDSFDPWGYDRDNGDGVAQQVVDTIRSSQSVAA